jgi:hypothetical protein
MVHNPPICVSHAVGMMQWAQSLVAMGSWELYPQALALNLILLISA